MSLGLFLDTSSKSPLMVLIQEETVKDAWISEEEKSSSFFLQDVKEFLEKNSVDFKDLNYICTGTGPGSFIGTRVGVILAKTFAYALKIPLLHFSSLMCYNIKNEGLFALISDAKSKGFYTLLGSKHLGHIEYDEKPTLMDALELAKISKERTLLCSDTSFLAQKNSCLQVDLTSFDYPQIAQLSYNLYKSHLINPSSTCPPEIFYLRLS